MGQPFTVDGERSQPRPNDELTFEYCDAGHVLGAAGILLRAEGRTVFYTGDVNFDDQTLTKGAEFPTSEIDVLIIESPHGAIRRCYRAFLGKPKSSVSQKRSTAHSNAAGAC